MPSKTSPKRTTARSRAERTNCRRASGVTAASEKCADPVHPPSARSIRKCGFRASSRARAARFPPEPSVPGQSPASRQRSPSTTAPAAYAAESVDDVSQAIGRKRSDALGTCAPRGQGIRDHRDVVQSFGSDGGRTVQQRQTGHQDCPRSLERPRRETHMLGIQRVTGRNRGPMDGALRTFHLRGGPSPPCVSRGRQLHRPSHRDRRRESAILPPPDCLLIAITTLRSPNSILRSPSSARVAPQSP